MPQGYLGSDTDELRKKIRADHRVYFEFAEELQNFAWDTVHSLPHIQPDDAQKLLSLTLFVRVIKSFSACVMLFQTGLWEDAKVVIRTGLFAQLRLSAILIDPAFVERYIRYDYVNRQKLIKPNLQPDQTVLPKEVISELNKEYQRASDQIREFKSSIDERYFSELEDEKNLARKVGALPLFNSVFGLYSMDAHVAPKSIETILTLQPRIELNWEPDPNDVEFLFLVACQILYNAIGTTREQMKMETELLERMKKRYKETFDPEGIDS